MSLIAPANAAEYRRLALEVFRQASADFTDMGKRVGNRHPKTSPVTRARQQAELRKLTKQIKAGWWLLRGNDASMWAKWFSVDLPTLRDWMLRTYPEWPAQLDTLEQRAETLRNKLLKPAKPRLNSRKVA